MQVQWIKSQSDAWLAFETFNLLSVSGSEYGVYVIWHAGNPGHVVYVGQGCIKGRLTAHRSNTAITRYARSGTLYVTWAAVSAAQVDGVERYLADTWRPLVGDAHPDVRPLAVNSPW
jgi:hypothetical protein